MSYSASWGHVERLVYGAGGTRTRRRSTLGIMMENLSFFGSFTYFHSPGLGVTNGEKPLIAGPQHLCNVDIENLDVFLGLLLVRADVFDLVYNIEALRCPSKDGVFSVKVRLCVLVNVVS